MTAALLLAVLLGCTPAHAEGYGERGRERNAWVNKSMEATIQNQRETVRIQRGQDPHIPPYYQPQPPHPPRPESYGPKVKRAW